MKKVTKKTVAKKPATKMQDGGTTKYYKTNKRYKTKEISEDKYYDKIMRNSNRYPKAETTVNTYPEEKYTLYDKEGAYTQTSPAREVVRTTKTKGLGKGKSVSRVNYLKKEKKGGVVKKVTAKKVMVKSKKK